VSDPVPPGKLRSIVTYLEMTAPPTRAPRPGPLEHAALLRAEDCTVSFYRYLYGTVGEPWLWWYRRTLPDAELAAIVQDPKVQIYVLYLRGVPAGYVELDRRETGICDLAYFGLMPEFIGRRLGPWFLDKALDMAWSGPGTEKVTVNTCTLDHPKALLTYQRAGFKPVEQETQHIDDPRLAGILPRDAAPHVPLAL